MKKIARKIKEFFLKTAGLFLALLVVFSGVFEIDSATKGFAYSGDKQLSFDTTDVMEDIGKTIDLSQYPAEKGKDPSVYSFMEYGYSDNVFKQGNYALYLYVYNPSQIDYVRLSGVSSINMAVEFSKEADGSYSCIKGKDDTLSIKVKEYANFPLKYCGATTGEYENLFVKFRVLSRADAKISTVLKNVTLMSRAGFERQYSIAGVQLHEKGKDLAKDYDFSQAVYYKGFGEGLGAGAELESTLSCRWDKLESVELDVKHTYWRSETSDEGAGYQNQLDTVYFAVPKRLFDTYGRLQRIKAEWYEYLTKEILVTENVDLYEFAKQHIGVNVNKNGENVPGYGFATVYEKFIGRYLGYGWNIQDLGFWSSFFEFEESDIGNFDLLHYVFFANDINVYDPYSDETEQGGVTSNALYDWIKSYSALYPNSGETLQIKNGNISADLFEEDIQGERKVENEKGTIQKGYSFYDFDADLDIQSWQSFMGSDPNFRDKLLYVGFWDALFNSKWIKNEENVELSPILEVTEGLILGNKDTSDLTNADKKKIADSLYINYNDVEDLHEFYQDAIYDSDGVEGKEDEEKVVVLFRFAVSDYFCYETTIVQHDGEKIEEVIKDEAYVAKQTVFLNFDVIQLTFNDSGVYTVIPVVADPIDIVNPVTPPPDPIDREGCLASLKRTMAYVLIALAAVALIWLGGKIRQMKQQRQIDVIYRSVKKDNKNRKE